MSFRITLKSVEPTPTGRPALMRLKGLLKVALRSFGFRCVNIEVLPGSKEG